MLKQHTDQLKDHSSQLKALSGVQSSVDAATEATVRHEDKIDDLDAGVEAMSKDIINLQSDSGNLTKWLKNDYKKLEEHTRFLNDDDKNIKSLSGRIAECETGLGIQAPEDNDTGEYAGNNSNKQVPIIEAPASEDLRAASSMPTTNTQGHTATSTPPAKEAAAPAPSSGDLQAPLGRPKFRSLNELKTPCEATGVTGA